MPVGVEVRPVVDDSGCATTVWRIMTSTLLLDVVPFAPKNSSAAGGVASTRTDGARVSSAAAAEHNI